MSCRIWVPIWNHKAFRPAAMKVELGLAPVPLWRIIPVHIRFTKWSRPPHVKVIPIVSYCYLPTTKWDDHYGDLPIYLWYPLVPLKVG